MYHSVSDHRNWLWGHLACPVKVFEDHIRTLAGAGFSAVSLQDIYDHTLRNTKLPKNPVAITFDDGYLDNWVYAFPILKKYGFRGTIFVSPEFVDPTPDVRPTFKDVEDGRISSADLQVTGFLSWAEMRAMESAGVMDIQSHTLTHTWCFSDDTLIDFHHPDDSYPWLIWNARPERKYAWLNEDQSSLVPFGMPVYAHERALAIKQYFSDPKLNDVLTNYVISHGNLAFFEEQDWSGQLHQAAANYRAHNQLDGRYETDQEYENRVRHELSISKEIISSKLDKKVNFLCWPGGGYNVTTEQIAKEVGYLAMTMSSQNPGRTPRRDYHLPRIGAPTLPHHGRTLYRDGHYLVAMLRCRRGNKLACLTCKALTGRDILLLNMQRLKIQLTKNSVVIPSVKRSNRTVLEGK